MTISSTTLRNSYTGNGSTTVFAYTFRILSDDEVMVSVDGVTQTKTTDYTVSGVGELNGGNITFVSGAPASGTSVIVKADPDFTQEIDYNELDAFPAESHETGLDRAAIRDLSLKEELDRAPVVPASVALSTNEIAGTVTSDNQVITVSTSGYGLSTIAASSAVLNFETETFNGTGAETDFTLTTFTPANAQSIEVSVGGVLQRPTDDYTVSGAVVTFLSAPASGTDNILVRNLATGTAATTPADSSVSTAKIQDNAVTLAKLEDGTQGDILYYGAAGAPTRLSAGTSGQVLKTNGAGANPQWTDAAAFASSDITGQTDADITASDTIVYADASDSDNLKKDTIQGILNLTPYQQIVSTTIAAQSASGSGSNIPLDNTAPTSSEGTEIVTLDITPSSASNDVRISTSFTCSNNGGRDMIAALFRGTTCIASAVASDNVANESQTVSFDVIDSPATTSATTYSIRFGKDTGTDTWYVSQTSAATLGGTLANQRFILEEIT